LTDHQRERTDALIADFRAALVLLTRFPGVAGTENIPFDYRRAAQMFPVVGIVIGAVGGVVLVLGGATGLPPLVTAGLAVAVTVALTGALHEDGLADTADGFGGGGTTARKLEIMDDSRIGTFGAVAVVLSILLRVAALAALVPIGGIRAAAALIAAEAVSRGGMVRIWHDLPPARPGGLADRAGPPDDRAAHVAVAVSALVVVVLIIPTFGLWAALIGCAAIVGVGFGCATLFINQIGGQTGDALGASQQCMAIGLLVAMTPFA